MVVPREQGLPFEGPCPTCTSIIDGIDARLLSSSGTSYNRDYGAEDDNGYQRPLATVFARRPDGIHHFWSSELWFATRDEGQDPRHVDFMWPLWAVFEHTPDGRGTDWMPQLDYK
jgi:predicted dithiol-disulfide oxidoreductase (DUF899 family)